MSDKTCQGGGNFAVLQVGATDASRTGDLTSPALCADVAVTVTFSYVIMEPMTTLHVLTRCAGRGVAQTTNFSYNARDPGWTRANLSVKACPHSATKVL